MINRRIFAVALSVTAALGCSASASAQEQTWVPLLSKGFQHQFWQAVKKGAENAGHDLNVRVTFEGPESETMVDKQIDMLAADLAKKPKVFCFAALDTQAATPCPRETAEGRTKCRHRLFLCH